MYPDKQHVHDSVNISQVDVQIHKFLVLKTHKNILISIIQNSSYRIFGMSKEVHRCKPIPKIKS